MPTMAVIRGSLIRCQNCGFAVGVFNADCEDYTNIPRNQIDWPNNPILTMEPNPHYEDVYSCPKCETEVMLLVGDAWSVVGIVNSE